MRRLRQWVFSLTQATHDATNHEPCAPLASGYPRMLCPSYWFTHAVSDRITDELIAVYGLLDSFLKSESDSKKKAVCCMSCSFRIFETEPDFSLQHVFSHVVADMYLTC